MILHLPERLETVEAVAVAMESERPGVYRLAVYGKDGKRRVLPREWDRAGASRVLAAVAAGLAGGLVITVDTEKLP